MKILLSLYMFFTEYIIFKKVNITLKLMNELIEKLNLCYSDGIKNHNCNELLICFGVKYASQIEDFGITPEILVDNSMIPNSYYSILIRQGIELSKYVKVVPGIFPEKQVMTPAKECISNDSEWVETTLQSIGKSVFVEYLYPELKKYMDITESELSVKYEEYASFSDNARKSRLSSAKSIFRRGVEKEALRIISSSGNLSLEVKSKAEELLDE